MITSRPLFKNRLFEAIRPNGRCTPVQTKHDTDLHGGDCVLCELELLGKKQTAFNRISRQLPHGHGRMKLIYCYL